MEIFETIPQLRKLLAYWEQNRSLIGFVPTMGNLHNGHLALIRRAREECDQVVVSIFVNPKQFGESEDLSSYPKTLAQDIALIKNDCDCLFIPTVDTIYPGGQCQTTIDIQPYTSMLCGQYRPGHFVGVLTVVNLLLNLVQPDRAYFGLKDFQQLWLIKRMQADLHFPAKIIEVDTGRDNDGLALSSRNQYLSKTEKELAPSLYQHIQQAGEQIVASEPGEYQNICQHHTQKLNELGFQVDYFVLKDATTLLDPDANTTQVILLAAAWLGKARLIDNLFLVNWNNKMPTREKS